MTILFSNNASTTISGSITALDTTVALAAGSGVIFPQPTGADYFVATFYDQATKTINEIVHVTNITGDVATIVRAQEGTTARAWNTADIFANLITAGTLRAFVQAGAPAANTSLIYVGTDISTTSNQIICPTTPVPASYAVGMVFVIKVANGNTGPVTCAFNGVPAVRASRYNGSDMIGGDITASEEMIFIYNGTDFTSMVAPIPLQPQQYIFYVRTDGNDSNTGLANDPQHAFATISGALYTIKQRYISALKVTVRVADGHYIDSIAEATNYVGEWDIIGNTSNPGNVIWDATPLGAASYPPHFTYDVGYCLGVVTPAKMIVSGFTFQSYYGAVISAGTCTVSNCVFVAPLVGGGGLVGVDENGVLSIEGNCTISGGTPLDAIFETNGGGYLDLGVGTGAAVTFNIAGNVSVTGATAISQGGGVIVLGTCSFTGLVPNCMQYSCGSGGGIAFGTGTAFPGTQPGVVYPPGWVS
jgi:hypothetical protein